MDVIDKEISDALDPLHKKIDPNREYDVFECMYVQSEGTFSDNFHFHRSRKLNTICVDGKPDHLQVLWLLDSEDGNSDTILFGYNIPKEAREYFVRNRSGDRSFTFNR